MLTLVAIALAVFVLPQPWGIVAVIGAAAIDIAQNVAFLRWSKRPRASVGPETLVGRDAVAVTALEPEGQVRLDGELWAARSGAPIQAGDEVVVRRVDGLTLVVERTR